MAGEVRAGRENCGNSMIGNFLYLLVRLLVLTTTPLYFINTTGSCVPRILNVIINVILYIM